MIVILHKHVRWLNIFLFPQALSCQMEGVLEWKVVDDAVCCILGWEKKFKFKDLIHNIMVLEWKVAVCYILDLFTVTQLLESIPRGEMSESFTCVHNFVQQNLFFYYPNLEDISKVLKEQQRSQYVLA